MKSRVPLVSLEHARELGEAMGLPARRTQSEAFPAQSPRLYDADQARLGGRSEN